MSPLRPFAEKIKAHWKQQRPKMTAALEASGDLDRIVTNVDNRRFRVLETGVQSGLTWSQAEELADQEWLLPSEEDEPNLNEPEESDDNQ